MGFWKHDYQIDELYQLIVIDGLSFSQAARVMGAVSRNVLLCKFNRLRQVDPVKWQVPGNPDRPRPVRHAKPKSMDPPPPPLPKEEELELFLLDGEAVTMENVKTNHCHYPIGDPQSETFRFCGHAVKEQSPYCPTHHAKCYQPNQPRKRSERNGRAA